MVLNWHIVHIVLLMVPPRGLSFLFMDRQREASAFIRWQGVLLKPVMSRLRSMYVATENQAKGGKSPILVSWKTT